MLLVEGHKVNKAETIMGGDKVDGVGGAPIASPFCSGTMAPPIILASWGCVEIW